MCNAFRDLGLAQYCPSPAHLAALPEAAKRGLREKLTEALREDVLNEGILNLLFLVTSLPKTNLATPNEMLEWVGLAAIYERDGYRYVLSKLHDRQRTNRRRNGREAGVMEEQKEEASVLERLEKFSDLGTLAPIERRYLLEAATCASREDLAKLWSLSLGGVKKRLAAIRKKIENF